MLVSLHGVPIPSLSSLARVRTFHKISGYFFLPSSEKNCPPSDLTRSPFWLSLDSPVSEQANCRKRACSLLRFIPFQWEVASHLVEVISGAYPVSKPVLPLTRSSELFRFGFPIVLISLSFDLDIVLN